MQLGCHIMAMWRLHSAKQVSEKDSENPETDLSQNLKA